MAMGNRWVVVKFGGNAMKKSFDYFDKIYCINLDSRRDRWYEVQKEFEKIDDDRSGFLEFDEIKAVIEKSGSSLDSSEIDRII